MKTVKILDCTLRDGGYINDWRFGNKEIKRIIEYLEEARIDIIECGFLQDIEYDKDVSLFSSVEQIKKLIEPKTKDIMYVAMIALGDIDVDKISDCDGSSIDGIRLTFHKNQWKEARIESRKLIEKGYKVFMQPVGTTVYSNEELIELVDLVNSVHPYAFYLVDTLGILHRNELKALFDLVGGRLLDDICIGLHSHNNLQLSFSNAQDFIHFGKGREVIVDASVFGMGRGVGNLATELIAEYINSNFENKYSIFPLLSATDDCIMPIYSKIRWGYGLPYFLSATQKCHPNYAAYLLKKETLHMEDISRILSKIPKEQRDMFFLDVIEQLYKEYQDCYIEDAAAVESISEKIKGRKVLLVAPGSSIEFCYCDINEFIVKEKPFVISVNHKPEKFDVDFVFASNKKRAELLLTEYKGDIVVTSNIPNGVVAVFETVNYSSYTGEGRAADNAGAMLIRLLKKCGIKELYLAGFDGFDVNSVGNFSIDSMRKPINAEDASQKNLDISNQLTKALQGISFEFITPTRYNIR